MIDPQLSGKVVMITGANHGIGAASAAAFARQGARVFLSGYRANPRFSQEEREQALATQQGGPPLYEAMQQQSTEAVVERIRAGGGQAHAWETDLGDPDNIGLLFDACEAAFGPVDVLVNNHTYCVLETFDPARVSQEGFAISFLSAAEIDAHFAVNSRAYALMMAEYVRRFVQRNANWGRMINISTDAAHAHEANVSYAASKHAIESYSRSAALELGHYGITVNIVAPGPIQTGYITPQDATQIAQGTPLGRVGQPEDVADVVVFLASEQAHWLTGQLLYAGGGWRIGQ